MDKRMGAESLMGVGGGTVSQESAKNLQKGEDLCRRRKPEQALPYLLKAMEDPNNLDAIVQVAFLMPTMDMGIQLLEKGAEKGRIHLRRILGPTCFDDGDMYAERFWSLLETRPYMRILQAIVRIAFENKDYNKSADTIIEMLRLCPPDNLGQRDWLGSVLLKAGRTAEALSFVQAWLDESKLNELSHPPRGGCTFEPPSNALLSAAFTEKNRRSWAPAEILYTAALASYKLWGDCELARQYLRLAAKANPNVLLKILAKIEQPKLLNNSLRSTNGPESAHDYLWLTQDLWMAPDVWSWANSDAETKSYVLKTCAREGCSTHEVRVAEFKRCAGCKEVVYCGQACQKEDWPAHKKRCKEHQRQKEFLKAMLNGRTERLSRSEDDPLMASADFTPSGITTTFY